MGTGLTGTGGAAGGGNGAWGVPALADRARAWQRLLLTSALCLLAGAALAMPTRMAVMPVYFLTRQDLPVVEFTIALYAILAMLAGRAAVAVPVPVPSDLKRAVVLLAIGMIALGWAGHLAVMHGYDFSRDEQMATFDAAIFAGGHLAMPLPQSWHGLLGALNDNFYFHPFGEQGLVSAYRPVNAMMRAALLGLGLDDLVSPLLAAVGLIATWRVAAHMWPDDREPQCVAVLLYATSVQIWAASMTSYAMSGHLALNMLWLALFLRGGRLGHAGAIVTGFLATGLHQLPYHPMFAGPFLCLLVLDRRWRLAALYAGAYALILLAWAAYFRLPMMGMELAKPSYANPGTYMTSSVASTFALFSVESVWLTAANLVRFYAWQNLLLLPLTIAGAVAAWRRRDRLLLAMVAAPLVVLFVKFFLSTMQGHGWGYRYLHGLIGVACLLAAAGWAELRRRGIADWRLLGTATALTVGVAAPWQLWQAHRLVAPYAAMNARIAGTDADMIVIDSSHRLYEDDLVINRADLSNRPVRLLAREIGPVEAGLLCRHGTIAFLPGADMEPIRSLYGEEARTSRAMDRARRALEQACPDRLR